MCNLYSITTNQSAIIALFRVMNRYVGNLPPMPGVFPDTPAPVVHNTGHGTELIAMRWGMPPPLRIGGPPVTNIRNTSSPHWRGWLKPENRCLVPFNSFAEYAPEPNPETGKRSPDERSDIRGLAFPAYRGACHRARIRATRWLMRATCRTTHPGSFCGGHVGTGDLSGSRSLPETHPMLVGNSPSLSMNSLTALKASSNGMNSPSEYGSPCRLYMNRPSRLRSPSEQ
jgi:hypothetical protein